MPFRYVPLLRSKTGEADALQNLAPRDKNRLLPIFHLVERPPATFIARAAAAWNGLPMAVDGLFNFTTTNSTADFITFFTGLARAGVNVVPSVDCDAPPPYVAAVQRFLNRHAPGLVIKATLRQLQQVDAWAAAQNFPHNQADLVILAGHAAGYDPSEFAPFVLNVLQRHLPDAALWRSVTLAASAAPQDHSALAFGRNDVPRLDWLLWNAVSPQVQFQLDYGDYGIAYPDLTEPPGIAMTRATVSVRYTVNNDWIVLKGRPTTGARGVPMTQQYRGHARVLVNDPQFGGLPNCWADHRVQQIAAAAPNASAGNRPQWVSFGVNRHLSLVANRLP